VRLKPNEATNEEIQIRKSASWLYDAVAVYVHVCRSDFSGLTYQLNAEMYITGLQRTLQLQRE